MTIEKAIAENTAALEENTAVQKKILAILEEGQGKKAAKEDAGESRGSRSRDRDEGGSRERNRDREDKDDDRGSRSRRDRDDEKDDDRGSRSRRDRDDEKDDDRGSRSRRDRDDEKDDDRRESRSRRDRDDEKEERGSSGSRSRDRDDEKEDDKGSSGRGSKKPKKPKLADVRAAFATFMEVNPKDFDSNADAKDEEEDRRKFVEAILDELGADKTSDIQEKDFEKVLNWIKRKADGEKVRFDD